MKKQIIAGFALVLFAGTAAEAQVATGGAYALDQTSVAAGGTASTGGVYRVEGTSGQTAAGVNSSGAAYGMLSGFWQPAPAAPTAGAASVGGRVLRTGGAGLGNAFVTLSGGNLTAPRTTRTNQFGSFFFDGIEVGQTYVISVAHRRYGFAQNSQVITVMDSVADLVFEAGWNN